MSNRSWSAYALVLLAFPALLVAGCARDADYEPRGSIKDTPEYRSPARAPVAKRPLARAAAASSAEPRLAEAAPRPPAPAVERPAAPARETIAAPATVPTPPPPRTSAPQTPQVVLPQQPPAAAPTPPRRPQPQQQMSGAQLLEEGRMLFRSGEVLAARERYVAALSAPLPEVLLELGRTYDPNYLEKLPRSDASADVERARALYEQAVTLGSRAAEADLARLLGPQQKR